MNAILLLFIILQIILFFFMTLHDWIHLPPFTDIRALEKHSTKTGRLINSAIFGLFILTPLSLTLLYQPHFPTWILTQLILIYGFLSLGTIISWWIPYFFGSSAEHKAGFVEYRHTHHFLPSRGDNLVPNTLHVILHLQIWTCFYMSLYLWLTS